MAEQNHNASPQNSPKMNWTVLSIVATVIVMVLYFAGGALMQSAVEKRKAEVTDATTFREPAEEPASDETLGVAEGTAGEGTTEATTEGETETAAAVDGEATYNKICASCHQQTGQGVPGVFPPLVESDWVTGDAAVPVKVVLKGLAGPITVNGQQYTGQMPPWEASMSDAEIAAVVTYIRSSWGNSADPVDTAFVADLREKFAAQKTPFKAADLR